MSKPKILFYDLETSPIIGHSWGTYEQNIFGIQKDSEILSVAWCWKGEKEIHCRSQKDFGGERGLLLCLKKILGKADVVVSHNGIKFDNKKANTRFVKHGLGPVKPYQNVDTLREARKHFVFPGNRLEDLARFFGFPGKIKTGGTDLWLACMAGSGSAWKKMKRYNMGDIPPLMHVYEKLLPWMNSHPNLALIANRPKGCPKCTFGQLEARGFTYTQTSVYRKYQCKACRGWCRAVSSEKKINMKAKAG